MSRIKHSSHISYTREPGDKIMMDYLSDSGPGSVVGIAAGYGLDGPGIECRCRRDFPHLSRPALEATQPPVQWVPGLSRGVGGKEWPGREADTSYSSSAVGHERVEYIPLLPLWTVRPVQSLSACTGVQFTFFLFIYLTANHRTSISTVPSKF